MTVRQTNSVAGALLQLLTVGQSLSGTEVDEVGIVPKSSQQ